VNQEVIRMRVGLGSSSEAVSDVNPLAFSRHHTGIVGTTPTREPTGKVPSSMSVNPKTRKSPNPVTQRQEDPLVPGATGPTYSAWKKTCQAEFEYE
jgi:hypothetical protein